MQQVWLQKQPQACAGLAYYMLHIPAQYGELWTWGSQPVHKVHHKFQLLGCLRNCIVPFCICAQLCDKMQDIMVFGMRQACNCTKEPNNLWCYAAGQPDGTSS